MELCPPVTTLFPLQVFHFQATLHLCGILWAKAPSGRIHSPCLSRALMKAGRCMMGGTSAGGGMRCVPFQVVEAFRKTQVTYAWQFVRIFICSSVVWTVCSPLLCLVLNVRCLQCELVLTPSTNHICNANASNEFSSFQV